MEPFDVQTMGKLQAAIQQVEAAIELFHARRYASAITLAAAAEGCLQWRTAGASGDEDVDLPGIEPLFELMKRGATEQYGKTTREAIERFNALAYWLKHETKDAPLTAEVSNYDAWSMIARAITKIEATNPGSETPTISAFVEHSRLRYADFLGSRTAVRL